MLSDILFLERMGEVNNVNNWETAIEIATKPLIDDGSVRCEYVNDMISSINKFGPYIVIDDYIAIPHAISEENVNKQSMSLLSIKEPVDLLGNPVKLFIVLAPEDRDGHMQSLAELSELLMDEEKKDVFINGSLQEINELIKKGA